jgi:ligand-binding SRPBCC domain-containing protein
MPPFPTLSAEAMPVIHLVTKINAPAPRCFDLSRSIDLHMLSTAHTNERAVYGITTGLIGYNEQVTWRAKHFGLYQFLTTRITEYNYPHYFKSSMLKGAFKKIEHTHYFHEQNGITVMQDVFDFEAPYGLPGKIIARIVLLPYMRKLLLKRNALIKQAAESDAWKKLPGMTEQKGED